MNKKLGLLLVSLCATFALTGCVKPYETPIIESIATDESAVMVPLVGDVDGQDTTEALEYYKENMVYTKEVTIPQRWVKTGRDFLGLFPNGEYRPSAKLIKVSRAPESREWVDASDEGTSTNKQGFDVESKDSIGFSFGVVATAQVEEDGFIMFLAQYGGRQLTSVMDAEIRNHVQAILSDVATKYDLENIDEMKKEAISEVRAQVIPYFKDRGITVTNLGFKGGLTYEDESIQKAFNAVITAEKQRDAQVLENERLSSKNATENEIKIAKALAEAEEAQIKAKNWAIYSKIRELDLEEKYLDTWDGVLPVTVLGDSDVIMDLGR